jgi:hypothetical protein
MRWVEEFARALVAAGIQVHSPAILEQDRPLTWLVELLFADELERKSWFLVKELVRGFAEANDGAVTKVDVQSRGMRFVVVMSRMYNVSVRNPLTDE